jgi:hypothetical protein
MHFNANNFTVSVLLLLALTVFMMTVRVRKPYENNWLLIYWLMVAVVTVTRPENFFDLRPIAVGVLAGLMLRFEFMNQSFCRVVMAVEMVVFAYILLASWTVLISA